MESQKKQRLVETFTRQIDEQKNFYVQQIYTGCLAEAAYYIESEKKAIVIDPLRDTDVYTQLAQERGAEIKYVFLTHLHADFVSGHIDLSQKTGSQIVYGPTACPNFEAKIAKDQEKFDLGKIQIQVLHTPGHTMESSTFLLLDNEKPYCIFTGDTLFLGEVGRPDLAVKGEDLTKEDLAAHLFDSLNNVIKPMPDDVIVYPGHGAGSACGKNIQAGTSDSLGNQKQTNYALKITDKQEFVKTLTSNLPTPPQYFFHDAALNKNGYENLEKVVERNQKPLSFREFQALSQTEGYKIIDSRDKFEYLSGFIKGSYSIDLKGAFAAWIGKLMTPQDKFVIITPEGKEYDTIIRLARIGFDNCDGYLKGGIEEWKNNGQEVSTAQHIEAAQFQEIYEKAEWDKYTFIDSRAENESFKGILDHFVNGNVWTLEKKLKENPEAFNKNTTLVCVCQTGQRSIPTISILTKFGYKNLIHVTGGFVELKKTTLPVKYE